MKTLVVFCSLLLSVSVFAQPSGGPYPAKGGGGGSGNGFPLTNNANAAGFSITNANTFAGTNLNVVTANIGSATFTNIPYLNRNTNLSVASYSVNISNYNLHTINWTNCTITLPAISNVSPTVVLGFLISSAKGSATITNANGVDLICGSLAQVITNFASSLFIYNDGTNWQGGIPTSTLGTANQIVVTTVGGTNYISFANPAIFPGQISVVGITNSQGAANTIAIYDVNTNLIKLANGGNNTLLHGTTPPTYALVASADVITAPQWTNVMNNGDKFATNGNTAATSYDMVASNNLGQVSIQAGLQNNTASALGVTPTPGLVLTNRSLAAAGAQQFSPTLRLAGNGWKTTATAASQPTYFDLLCIPVQGAANPTSVFTISNTINAGTPTFCFQLDQGGNAQFGGGVLMTSFTNSGFSGTAGVLTNGADNVPRVAGVIPASMVGGAPVVYSGNSGPTVVPISQTTFFSPDQSYGTNQFQTSDATGITRILMPFPGQVVSAYVICSANPGAVANTFTVMTNGVATGIVVTLNNVTSGNDTAHITIPMLAGTEIGIKLITGAGTAVRWEWGIMCRPSGGF